MTDSHFPPLSEAAIRAAIDPAVRDKVDAMLIHDTVTSTSDLLWQRFNEGHANAAVAIAETQTAGRGRRGDLWHSPASGNLYLSLFWPFPAQSMANGLSIAIGISLINTLKQEGINDLQLKWPNDVLHQRRKLAGILVESRFRNQYYTVVGIGLNFKLPVATQNQIQQPTTSLQQLCSSLPCRNRLAGTIIQNMIETLEIFQHRGLTDFLPHWPQYDALHEEPITLISDEDKFTALACGINEQGELRYFRDNQIHTLSNSHISIRFNS